MVVHPKKILVIDDDQDIREIIMMILEEEGFHVTGLHNGSTAVSTIKETQPDLVLLDVQLGDSDGRDICRELKTDDRTYGIPVMMISANHNWLTIQDKNCQANDFLAKPFDISDLVAHVRTWAA